MCLFKIHCLKDMGYFYTWKSTQARWFFPIVPFQLKSLQFKINSKS